MLTKPKQNSFPIVSSQNNAKLPVAETWDFNVGIVEPAALLTNLGSRPEGLFDSEVRERSSQYGLNEAVHKARKGIVWEIFIRFTNPLIILLFIIATVSAFFSDRLSAAVIFVMAIASVIMSYFQEHKAEMAAETLKSLVTLSATVVRGGKESKIDHRMLVPGDIVHLSAGDMVPADLRLIAAKDLFVNQSALTGESFPVEKFPTSNPGVNATKKGDNQTLAFMGSSITSGTAVAVVVYTGKNTSLGALQGRLAEQTVETSFDVGIREFTWLMIRSILALIVIILVINLLGKGDFKEALLFALAVAVGLTPETLPMIITLNLSKGALDMSAKKVIIKRLDAIQNFGAMDILCTDKTGTLTQDNVVLEKYCDIEGNDDEEVLRYGYMNSFYQTGLKNILDKAILNHNHAHLHHFEKVDEVPFDFSRRIVSVAVKVDGNTELVAKGAPESIGGRCMSYELAGKIKKITPSVMSAYMAEYDRLSAEGFRVLAVAYKRNLGSQIEFSYDDETDLVLKGFLAFLDPPKEDAQEALDLLEERGISLKVLTGDNEIVTKKICTEVDIDASKILTGLEMEAMDDAELKQKIEEVTVFARLLPMQKEKIVRMLHENGHTVGYLGDGINDAPALKAADVGITVNNAVDVAKDAASIILLKKNLMVLVEGVVEGRKVFGNIIKYLRMSSSSNFGNMISMTVASVVLPFMPMAPVQILLNNFLYDISQTGIPADAVDEEYGDKPKPWNINLIKKFMVTIGPISSIFDLATFWLLWHVFQGYNNVDLFHTGWFLESLLTQTLVIYIIRTKKIPFLESWPSRPVVATTLGVLMVGFLLPFIPLAKAFGLVHVPFLFFIFLLVILALYLAVVQLAKQWFIKKFGYE